MQPHEVAVPIMFFLVAGSVWVTLLLVRHRERMTMVEKGMSSEDIKSLYKKQVQRDPLSSLKWGILFICAGLAVLIGHFLHRNLGVEEGIMIGLIPLFVGCGLLLFYSFASKKENQ